MEDALALTEITSCMARAIVDGRKEEMAVVHRHGHGRGHGLPNNNEGTTRVGRGREKYRLEGAAAADPPSRHSQNNVFQKRGTSVPNRRASTRGLSLGRESASKRFNSNSRGLLDQELFASNQKETWSGESSSALEDVKDGTTTLSTITGRSPSSKTFAKHFQMHPNNNIIPSPIPPRVLSLPLSPPTSLNTKLARLETTPTTANNHNNNSNNSDNYPSSSSSLEGFVIVPPGELVTRKEKARTRVQQYIRKIDRKIQGGKQLKRVYSVGDIGYNGTTPSTIRPWEVGEPHPHTDDWTSSDSRRHSFGGVGGISDDKSFASKGNGSWKQKTSTVFRANAALELDCDSKLPFDESSIIRQEHRRHITSLSRDDGDSESLHSKARSKKMHQRQHSLRSVKSQSNDDVSLLLAHQREKEMQQFEYALQEAQQTVEALETTIELLEEASLDKNESIRQLEKKIEELELAVEENGVQEEIVELLQEHISKLESLVQVKDQTVESLQSQMKELERELTETAEKFAQSQEALLKSHNDIAEKDKLLESVQNDASCAQDAMAEKMEQYRKEIASSLESKTRDLDEISKEKDILIQSLNEQIQALEKGWHVNSKKVGVLNEKISTLAIALTEKDKQINALQRELAEEHEVKKELGHSLYPRYASEKEDIGDSYEESLVSSSQSVSTESRSLKGSLQDHVQYLQGNEPKAVILKRSKSKGDRHRQQKQKLTFVDFEGPHQQTSRFKSPRSRMPITPECPRKVCESRDEEIEDRRP